MSALIFNAACRKPVVSFAAGICRHTLSRSVNKTGSYNRVQLYASQTKAGSTRGGRIKVSLLIGGFAAAEYGLSSYFDQMLNKQGGLKGSVATPMLKKVRKNISDSLFYCGSGLVVTAVSALICAKNPLLMNIMKKSMLKYYVVSIAATAGSAMCLLLPYPTEADVLKNSVWLFHNGAWGALVAPLVRPLRSVVVLTGLVGGIINTFSQIPSEKVFKLSHVVTDLGVHAGGDGLGVVLASLCATSLSSTVVPPTIGLGHFLFDTSVIGSLVVFPWLTLNIFHSLQKAMEIHFYPVFVEKGFDPVKASIGLMLPSVLPAIMKEVNLEDGKNSIKKKPV